jgi:hypothetical protein
MSKDHPCPVCAAGLLHKVEDVLKCLECGFVHALEEVAEFIESVIDPDFVPDSEDPTDPPYPGPC